MPTDRNFARQAAQVYAKALLDAASNADRVFAVSGDLAQAQDAVRSSIELRETLKDHTLPLEGRQAIVREVFSDLASELVEALCVMVERDELTLLGRVREDYDELAEAALGAVFIDVVTAVALDDALRAAIVEKYSGQFGRDVLLREHVEPSILGGIILSAHGQRIDASIASQLENARATLAQTT
ncbi:MAG: ATP synthase F1 subunit delta [Coriobacteriales bacterium]|jgi:F-type H+-transporting ATPase subunit delta|nr:ATP synthase F1 subunit delta [Coriobacteriales bacterium]